MNFPGRSDDLDADLPGSEWHMDMGSDACDDACDIGQEDSDDGGRDVWAMGGGDREERKEERTREGLIYSPSRGRRVSSTSKKDLEEEVGSVLLYL